MPNDTKTRPNAVKRSTKVKLGVPRAANISDQQGFLNNCVIQHHVAVYRVSRYAFNTEIEPATDDKPARINVKKSLLYTECLMTALDASQIAFMSAREPGITLLEIFVDGLNYEMITESYLSVESLFSDIRTAVVDLEKRSAEYGDHLYTVNTLGAVLTSNRAIPVAQIASMPYAPHTEVKS